MGDGRAGYETETRYQTPKSDIIGSQFDDRISIGYVCVLGSWNHGEE